MTGQHGHSMFINKMCTDIPAAMELLDHMTKTCLHFQILHHLDQGEEGNDVLYMTMMVFLIILDFYNFVKANLDFSWI